MKDIDFLPARYRDRERLRRAHRRRIAAFATLTAILLLVHVTQLAMRGSVEQQLREVSAPYAEATAVKARVDRLRADLAMNEHFAALYTYLEHPWPRTQLLMAVTQTLPDHVALTELGIPPPQPAARKPNKPDETAKPPLPPAALDLQALREEVESGAAEVILKGVAAHSAALHDYVASFSSSSLFVSARLESMESVKEQSMPGGSRFELRLRICPAYGHKGGPGAPARLPPLPEQTAGLVH